MGREAGVKVKKLDVEGVWCVWGGRGVSGEDVWCVCNCVHVRVRGCGCGWMDGGVLQLQCASVCGATAEGRVSRVTKAVEDGGWIRELPVPGTRWETRSDLFSTSFLYNLMHI